MSASEPAGADCVLGPIAADPWRMTVLRAVRDRGPPDAWVGAGFVRNLVWDDLHGYEAPTPLDDVDVLYFDPSDLGWAAEEAHEAALGAAMAGVPWSVRNQARMHLRNGDAPYADAVDAMRHWLETATPVAARLGAGGGLDLAAPLGLDDLLALRLRPTAAGRQRPGEYRERVARKRWAEIWPRLTVELPPAQSAIDAFGGNQ